MAITVEQSAWMERVLGFVSANGTAKGSANGSPGGGAAGLQVWQHEREAAVGRLKALSAAIAASGDAEARDAIVLVQAIIKNLAPKPADGRAVAELQRWLRTDDILEDAEAPNPFGITVDVRAPLLAALDRLAADFKA